MTTYDIGDVARLTAVFRDEGGVLVDPTTVTYEARKPGGSLIAYTYGVGGQLVRVSAGTYRVDQPVDEAGLWNYRFKSTGLGQAAQEDSFHAAHSEADLQAEAPYSTVENLRMALAPSGVDQRTGDTAAGMTNTQLIDAINEAAGEVDLRLARRYAVPFAPVPPIVSQLTRDIAAYTATLTHRRGNTLDADHPVRLRYTKAVELLTALANGTIEIEGASGGDDAQATVVNVGETALFAAEDFGIWRGYDWGRRGW